MARETMHVNDNRMHSICSIFVHRHTLSCLHLIQDECIIYFHCRLDIRFRTINRPFDVLFNTNGTHRR
jgi:hypothetical protein